MFKDRMDAVETLELLQSVRTIEEVAHVEADLVVYCAESDRDATSTLIPSSRSTPSIVVENGVELATISYHTEAEHQALKKAVFGEASVALFLGSWHEPNIEAVRVIIELAKVRPEIYFVIAGSVCDYFKEQQLNLPPNLLLLGVISDAQKSLLFGCADVALNPMLSGSGTNIKMFDYLAAGIPVLSTPTGARGIQLPPEGGAIRPVENFADEILTMLCMERSASRRRFVEADYSWATLAHRYANGLEAALERA